MCAGTLKAGDAAAADWPQGVRRQAGGEQPVVSASWRKALIALQGVIAVFGRPGSRGHTALTHVSSSASKHCSSSVLLPL